MHDDGYPSYRRRDNNVTSVDARGNTINNRWVVPHNLWLATKYNAHINVEVRIRFILSFPLPYTEQLNTTLLQIFQVCSTIHAVKYLFKYVYKGHDSATTMMEGPIDELK